MCYNIFTGIIPTNSKSRETKMSFNQKIDRVRKYLPAIMGLMLASAIIVFCLALGFSRPAEAQGEEGGGCGGTAVNKHGSKLCQGEDGPSVTFRNGQVHFFYINNCNGFKDEETGVTTTVCHNGEEYGKGRRSMIMVFTSTRVISFAVSRSE